MSFETQKIREIILNIYDTIADNSLWPTVLDQIATHMDARGSIIFDLDIQDGKQKITAPYFSDNYKAERIEAYINQFHEYEVHDQAIFEAHSLQSDGINLIDDDVLAPCVDDLRLRPNVQAFIQYGMLHRAGCLLNKDNSYTSRYSLQLGIDRGRLTADEHQKMSQILPHLAKAIDLGHPAKQLQAQHLSLLATMDRLTIGISILDKQGRIIISNEEFKRQKEAYGLFSTKLNGEFQLTHLEEQKKFSILMQDALHHGNYGARPRKEAITSHSDTVLCIEVAPLMRSHEFGSNRINGCILYSIDTSRTTSCNTHLAQKVYGFTNTETTLVEMIVDGLTNPQIAERRNRSIATINSQVKNILSKTGCSTRAQFVRLMMGFGTNFLNP